MQSNERKDGLDIDLVGTSWAPHAFSGFNILSQTEPAELQTGYWLHAILCSYTMEGAKS